MFIEMSGSILNSFGDDVWPDKAINISPLRGCFLDRLKQTRKQKC